MRTWRRTNRSPPSHAAIRASSPIRKAVQGKSVPVCLAKKYIIAQAGATAKKTVPTNLARKLEKLVIGN